MTFDGDCGGGQLFRSYVEADCNDFWPSSNHRIEQASVVFMIALVFLTSPGGMNLTKHRRTEL